MNLGCSPHNLNPTHAPEKFDNFIIFSVGELQGRRSEKKNNRAKYSVLTCVPTGCYTYEKQQRCQNIH